MYYVHVLCTILNPYPIQKPEVTSPDPNSSPPRTRIMNVTIHPPIESSHPKYNSIKADSSIVTFPISQELNRFKE
jgi:hypothetical protein